MTVVDLGLPQRARVVAKTMLDTAVGSRAALGASDLLALRYARLPHRPPPAAPPVHVLVATVGSGNIGDQAMVDAFIEGVGGRITVLVQDEESFSATGFPAEVEVAPVGNLVDPAFRPRRSALRAYRSALANAASVSIVGADIMDGGYGRREAYYRLQIADIAARAGLPTRVLGFSWGEDADLLVTDRCRSLAGVRLLLRDPVSAGRARRDGLPSVEDAADIVFSAIRTETSEPLAWCAAQKAAGRRIVVLNISGLIARGADLAGAYRRSVRALVSSGHSVLILPHVIRPGDDDLSAARAAIGDLESSQVRLVDTLLSPAQVRLLVREAWFIVSGRMHLGVIGLSQGVPAVIFATRGKVRGLLELFGMPELEVEPDSRLEERLHSLVLTGDQWVPVARARVTASLPRVIALARRNLVSTNGMPEGEEWTAG